MEKQYEKIMMRHTFTDDERADMSSEMAEASVKKESLEEDFDVVKKDYTSQIRAEEGTVRMISRKLHAGFEMQQVKCEKRMDYDRKEVLLIHPDTLEIVKTRTMTQNELQMDIFEGEVGEVTHENQG